MRVKLLLCFFISILFLSEVYSKTPTINFFEEAEVLFEKKQFKQALDIYLDIIDSDSTNFYVSYKIGLCYIETPYQIWKAIPYLEKSLQSVSDKNRKDCIKEKIAPFDVYYYLGFVYHQIMQLVKAEKYYTIFKENQKKNSELSQLVDTKLAECKVAREYFRNPKPIEIENVSQNINSGFSDFNPCVSANDSVMYFTREVILTGSKGYREPVYRIMRSYKTIVNGEPVWGMAEDISQDLLSDGDSYTLSTSFDGTILVLFKDNDMYEGIIADDLGEVYLSYLKDGKWSEMTKMPKEINTAGSETNASISSDGKTIYFVDSIAKAGRGKDIFVTKLGVDGLWSKAENLGETINSELDEETPFILNDTILFFSSKGHRGMGGYDVYKSIKSNGKWSSPENLSIPVNSPANDIGFSPTHGGKQAYYSVERPDGYLTFGAKDIYHIVFVDDSAGNTASIVKQVNSSKIVIEKSLHLFEIEVRSSLTHSNLMTDFGDLPVGEHYGNDGYYRYVTGKYYSKKAAKADLKQIADLGYENAIIQETAFYDDLKIDYDYTKKYTIQVYVSTKRENIIKKFTPLKNIAEFEDASGLYRYCIGGFDTWKEAKTQLDTLIEQGFDGFIVGMDSVK